MRPRVIVAVLLTPVVAALLVSGSFVAGRLTAHPTTVDPIVARAERDVSAFVVKDGELTFLQRNAVVVNFTVGVGRELRRKASAWYFRDGGGWKLAGVQWFQQVG